NLCPLHTEIRGAVLDEHVEFFEGTLVQEHVQAFAGGKLSTSVLRLDARRPATQPCRLATALEFLENILHALSPVGREPPRSTAPIWCKQRGPAAVGPAAWMKATGASSG